MAVAHRKDHLSSLGDPLAGAEPKPLVGIDLGLDVSSPNFGLISQRVLHSPPVAFIHLGEETDLFIGKSSVVESHCSQTTELAPRGGSCLFKAEAKLGLLPAVSQLGFLLDCSCFEVHQIVLSKETGKVAAALVLHV